MLNPVKGNMYNFCTHTWNTVKGKCPHDCSYCYMKRFGEQKPIRFDKKELKTDLGKGNFIFVGSSCDMWADEVPNEWILDTLEHCRQYKNKYLFQTKNPGKFYQGFEGRLPKGSYIGTTIETNKLFSEMGNAPEPINRAKVLNHLSYYYPTMVTVEPIMDFDTFDLVHIIRMCDPEWVNVGADSQNSGLPEPSADKVKELIRILKMSGVKVKIKDNLKRLCPDAGSEDL